MRRNANNPSTLIYWNDLEGEPGLKFCGLAGQGLWLKMLGIAARSSEHGVVLIGDHPSLMQDMPALLATSCGESAEAIGELLNKLITFKVASIDNKGRVYNRRMVAEAKLSANRSEAGRKGAHAANRKRQKSGKGVGKQDGKATGERTGKTPASEQPESVDPPTTSAHEACATVQQSVDNGTGKSAPSSFFSLSSVSKDTGVEAPQQADALELPAFLDRRPKRDGDQGDHVDLAGIVFHQGLDWLQRVTGKPADACRKLLGKWRKGFGDDAALIAALGAVQRAAPIDAVSWMEAAIKARRASGKASPRSAWADGLP